ncbi:MAG: hypothetical protein JWP56_2990 [Aeromicrobium sp.]|nr:hypothetical protein [Aeromicrobium sp.]
MTVRILASGLDALYLSGTAELRASLVSLLEARRESAAVQGNVQVPLGAGPEGLTVGWGPWGQYRFRLEHPNALIGLTQSTNLPPVRMQPRAEFLHAVGPEGVVEWCNEFAADVLASPVIWQVSRVDLFADVQGWNILATDRRRFAARANSRRTYEDGDELTGLQWGAGKSVLARIYDKTVEVQKDGKDWWPSVWGSLYDPSQHVIRTEFQVKRDALREFGLHSPEQILDARPTLWKYLTENWLSLREPSGDSNLSRRSVDPDWLVIQTALLNADGIGKELVRSGSLAGDLRRLIPALVGYATRFGALAGAVTMDDLLDVLHDMLVDDERTRGISVEERIYLKSQSLGWAA